MPRRPATGPPDDQQLRLGFLPPTTPAAGPRRRALSPSPLPQPCPSVDDLLRHRDDLTRRLQALMAPHLAITLHDNRSTVLSFRRKPGGIDLRLHWMFAEAGPDVMAAIARYVLGKKTEANRILDGFIARHRHLLTGARLRSQPPADPVGRVYRLDIIFERLNNDYFHGSIDASIGWGKGTERARRRTIRMGAYMHETRSIVIHPALDSDEVPPYVLEFVVYHEMLHQAVPASSTAGRRRCVHPPEFRVRERQFHAYEQAMAWEKARLGVLLGPKTPPRPHPAPRPSPR